MKHLLIGSIALAGVALSGCAMTPAEPAMPMAAEMKMPAMPGMTHYHAMLKAEGAAVSSGDLTEPAAFAQHERLTEMKMRLLGDRVSRRTAWKIAREQQWESTFDAEYPE